MAAKPYRTFLLATILVMAGVGSILIIRSRLYNSRLEHNQRFVSAFTALSIAKEEYSANPESLEIAFGRIYSDNGIDSVWIREFAASLAKDITRSRVIWDEIVRKLDSAGTSLSVDAAAKN
jgi:hypothetical protein